MARRYFKPKAASKVTQQNRVWWQPPAPGTAKVPVLAFDPGVTTGICLLGEDGRIVQVKMITGAEAEMDLGKVIVKVKEAKPAVHVVIEDFVGMGKRSPAGIYTLKLVGWLTNICRWLQVPGALHPPGARKWCLPDAHDMIAGSRHRKDLAAHTVDATGHALAYWRAL